MATHPPQKKVKISPSAENDKDTVDLKAMKAIPAMNFHDIVNLVGGPQVTIFVGKEKKKFEFPKALLYGHSQVLELDEDSPEVFLLLIGWIYKGKCELPTGQALPGSPEGCCDKVSSYIAILLLADKLMIPGAMTYLLAEINSMFTAPGPHPLLPSHIRLAAELPQHHALRKSITSAAVIPFLATCGTGTFRYEKELEEVEGFAKDLLKAVGETVTSGSLGALLYGGSRTGTHR